VFALRRSEAEPRYRKETIFDFSTVSDEELIHLAMYTCKVKVQALLRNMPQEQMVHPDTLSRIDVKADIIQAQPRSANPMSAAIRSLVKTGISEDVARQMLADAHEKANKGKDEGKRERAKAA
jgi:hypothetical protein